MRLRTPSSNTLMLRLCTATTSLCYCSLHCLLLFHATASILLQLCCNTLLLLHMHLWLVYFPNSTAFSFLTTNLLPVHISVCCTSVLLLRSIANADTSTSLAVSAANLQSTFSCTYSNSIALLSIFSVHPPLISLKLCCEHYCSYLC
jgi:hypothetical protein